MRTQVGIVGAGPAGLTLAMLLQREGIECVVLEARTREYVEKRVRAGLLEQNTVNLLRDLGVADRLDREGIEHSGIYLRHQGRNHHLDMTALTGRHITIYGQQEVVKDLVAALLERGADVRFEVSDVALGDLDSDTPRITFAHDNHEDELVCDAIAGCDGFHGVSRPTIAEHLTEYEYVYEFGWLGILADAAPATDELIYAWHEHGFALHSMRSSHVSRLYLQVPADEDIEALARRPDLGGAPHPARSVNVGPVFEKGITPMRSFVAEPMQHGRLFLAGDSAHIVPPTGAKGLNLAVNDVRLLAAGPGEAGPRAPRPTSSTGTRPLLCAGCGAPRTLELHDADAPRPRRGAVRAPAPARPARIHRALRGGGAEPRRELRGPPGRTGILRR